MLVAPLIIGISLSMGMGPAAAASRACFIGPASFLARRAPSLAFPPCNYPSPLRVTPLGHRKISSILPGAARPPIRTPIKALSMSSFAEYSEEDEEERLDRNEMLAEAYADLAADIKNSPDRPLVEVALDAPPKWWAEVVTPRLKRIAAAGNLAPGKRVLDVGTGAGAMVALCTGEDRAFESDVVGVDLCEEMLDMAQQKFPDAGFVLGDIVDLILSDLADDDDASVDPSADPMPFDAIFFTSVFGSLPDQKRALTKAAELASRGGRIVIGHPLGAAFVASLNKQDDVFTPNLLPSRARLEDMVKHLPLSIASFEEEDEFYLASLDRIPYSVLPTQLFMRGPVAAGYGRGGKKLGVPTANLPQSLFSGNLAAVPAGVYCGWASVNTADGATAAVKAVVNVGYSPTFVGEENREKIVEAHLMGYKGGDFYEREMRLVLTGFQRGEKKFAAFPLLVAAIQQDIADAKAALDTPRLAALARHPYLRTDSGMATWMPQAYQIAFKASTI